MTTKAASTAMKPAFDFDMFKSFGQFKVPGMDMESMMATQRKNLEAAAAANQVAFEGISAMLRRQAEVAREGAEAGMKAVTDLSAAAPEERAAKQADLAKNAYASFFANGREVFDMATKTANETLGLINARITATIDESKTAFAQK
jgi:phasin family protein